MYASMLPGRRCKKYGRRQKVKEIRQAQRGTRLRFRLRRGREGRREEKGRGDKRQTKSFRSDTN